MEGRKNDFSIIGKFRSSRRLRGKSDDDQFKFHSFGIKGTRG